MTRSDSAAEASSTLPIVNGASASASSAPGASLTPLKPGSNPRQNAPRIDIEPLYTALKAQIGEHWAAYKEAISLFVLGEFVFAAAFAGELPLCMLPLTCYFLSARVSSRSWPVWIC